MKKYILIFIIFSLLTHTAGAQNKKILDSLAKEYKKVNHDTIQSLILSEIARQYRQSFPDTARLLANKGLEFAKKINYQRGIANNLNILGIVELTKGNYLQSVTYLFEGLEMNRKINNLKDISTNLNNIGEVYRLQKNYKEALRYYDEALKINEKIGYREGVAIILNNLGEIYTEQGKYEEALTYLFQSLKICEEINNESRAALRLNNIGEVYAKQQKYPEALESFAKAIKLSEKFNDKLHIAREYCNIAHIYLQTNDFKKSLDYAQQALTVSKQINAKKEIAESLRTFSEIHKKAKDYNNALTYYQLFVAYQDSLNNEEVTKKVKEIQFNYEMGQKEKEIALLEVKNSLREKDAYTRLLFSIFFAVCVLFLLILAAILYQKNKFKKKANDVLLEKNTTTESQNRELNKALATVEKQRIEMLTQNEELSQQKEELIAINEKLENKNKLIESQKEELEKINSRLVSNEVILKKSYIKIKENEVKIKEQSTEIVAQNEQLSQKQAELIRTNDDLATTFRQFKTTSDRLNKSMAYANQIQQLILPKKEKLDSFFGEYFVLYLPKDIVSGDFYWFTKLGGNRAMFVLADCTGHGVPGAFMSMIGNTLLHEIIKVKNIHSPAEILASLHAGIRNILKQQDSKNSDGMDTSICLFEKDDMTNKYQITFAGAKSSIFYGKDSTIHQLDGNKISIGGFTEKERLFTNQTFTLQKGEVIYFTSDGYIDQNNASRERFSTNKFKKLLASVCDLPIGEQEQIILSALKEHQKDEEQRDDISVVGIRL